MFVERGKHNLRERCEAIYYCSQHFTIRSWGSSGSLRRPMGVWRRKRSPHRSVA